MELLKKHLDQIRIPSSGDKIYKDECVYSFDTPESPHGLFICLNTFIGLGYDFVMLHHQKTGNCVFLNMKKIAHEIPQAEESKPKITKLAIGVEGGFESDANQKKYTYEEINSIVILPEFAEIPITNADLPEVVLSSVSSVIAFDAAFRLEELQALEGTWDGEKRKVSKHAENLVQLDNGIKIPPKGWKCELCDKIENLWLNLTDGKILCGRKFYDGTGGNNHASEHYQQAKYPLAVKLGTITPDGADVYSYDEDDMVEDPHLAKHLAHFGINVANMVKTEKSMLELEIDYNQNYDEWAIIQEKGSQLQPLYGPGYTGLVNLGNSCYLNSVMQAVFSIEEFQKTYYPPDEIYAKAPADPTNDVTCQMAKLAYGLLSGKYSQPNNGQTGIKPTMFKNLIGRGHYEFSTKRQQDAQEFFSYLITVLERNNRTSSVHNVTDSFKFQVEDRIECVQSKKVTYNTRTEYLISLPIPSEDKMLNIQEYQKRKEESSSNQDKIDSNEMFIPRYDIEECFKAYSSPNLIEDFYSTALNAKSIASQTTKLRTFPEYLMVHIKKFTLGDDWVPKKLNANLQVPDIINLSYLRGYGLQPGEEQLPAPSSASSKFVIEFSKSSLNELMEMGFSLDACKRALYSTSNSGVEAATNWIMEHMTDPDFNDPFTLDNTVTSDQTFTPDSNALASIISMGFTQEQALKALKETNNNTERAIDWIFSHQEELDKEMQVDQPSVDEPQGACAASTSNPTFRDGVELYKLVAFISHMGTSTMCGHYVCHILKDNRWVIYNDEKVTISEHPPKELAYLYLYQRYKP